jgi:hypothetical protein
MRVMTVEVARADAEVPGHVRIELAPSTRIAPNGVYVGINAHYQLTREGNRGNGREAARVLGGAWEAARAIEERLMASLLKAV